MEPDQPSTESAPSIESRLSAVFATPKPEEAEAPPVEAVAETEEGTPETEVSDDLIDFEADDGTTIKLPVAAKDAVLRHADYTRKTQQLADLQKLAQDKIQFADAREQLSAAVLEDLSEFRGMEKELQQYKQVDWEMLYQANPGQAFALQQKQRDLQEKVSTKEREIRAKAESIQQAAKKHGDFQWAEAEKSARSVIGNITAAENAAMAQTVKALGFTESEFKSRFADPRVIVAIHKAAKWDLLQAGKGKAVETATNAPPVVKPGAFKGAAQAADKQYKELRSRLEKSGSVKDAAKLFAMRGLK